MKFYDWYKASSRQDLEELARKVERSPDYLSLMARGHRNASFKLAIAIGEHLDCVTKYEIRPDIFGEDPNSNPPCSDSASL